jgi:hypothetical protein
MKQLFNLVTILVMSVTFLLPHQAQAQVQSFSFKDNTFPYQMNIGKGTVSQTVSNAYLEIGPGNSATKGVLMPRGNKFDIVSPTQGMIIFDIPTQKFWVWANGQWEIVGNDLSGPEMARDAVGAALQNSTSINWTLDDFNDHITGDVSTTFVRNLFAASGPGGSYDPATGHFTFTGYTPQNSTSITWTTDATAGTFTGAVSSTYIRNLFSIASGSLGLSYDPATGQFTSTGGITSLQMTTPGVLYNSPVTFTNTSGAWSGALALKTQSAYTIFGNHTSVSATPTFDKLPVQSINATGSTYDGTKTLLDNGTWGNRAQSFTELDPYSILNRTTPVQTASFNINGTGAVGNKFTFGNLTTDPTGTNGGFYYNTTSNKFRGYINGAWSDLPTTGDYIQNQTASTQVAGFRIGKDANTFASISATAASMAFTTNDATLGGVSIVKPMNANNGAGLTVANGNGNAGKFEFLGGSSSGFFPVFRITMDATNNSGSIQATANSDAGTSPTLTFDARNPSNGVLATKPLFSWGSAGTTYMHMKANGNLILGGTSTASTTNQSTNERLQVNGNTFVSGDVNAGAGGTGGTFNVRLATPVQNAVVGSLTGGTMGTSNFLFRVSAIDYAGNESAAEAVGTTFSSTGTGQVTLSWPSVYGAYSYRVYTGNNTWGTTASYFPTTATTMTFTANPTGGTGPVTIPTGNNSAVVKLSSTAQSIFAQGLKVYQFLNLATSFTPTGTSDATGTTGDVARDDNFLYIKTSTGWKRATLSTF